MSTARIWRAPALVVLTGWLGIGACARGGEAGDDDVASAGGEPGTAAHEYELSPTSRVELDLGGRARRAGGSVELVRGRLWVDADALDRTRADLIFDMTTTRLEGDPPTTSSQGGRSLTEQSLDWLEVRRGSGLGLHPERQYAHVSLLLARSADGNAARSALVVPATHPGAVARRARVGVSGELELHGVRRPYTAALLATFEWADPALTGPPRHIELSTVEPVIVDWLGHDIVPRDARGDRSSVELAEMRRQPARTARIGVRWTAELAHTGAAPPPR